MRAWAVGPGSGRFRAASRRAIVSANIELKNNDAASVTDVTAKVYRRAGDHPGSQLPV
jgi:hypothetical protein